MALLTRFARAQRLNGSANTVGGGGVHADPVAEPGRFVMFEWDGSVGGDWCNRPAQSGELAVAL